MAHGLEIYNEAGDARLVTSDRQLDHIAVFTGNILQDDTVTLTAGLTGFDITSGLWGLDVSPLHKLLDVTCSLGQVQLHRKDVFQLSTDMHYRVMVFKL